MKNKTKNRNWGVGLRKTKIMTWYYSPTKDRYEHKNESLSVEQLEDMNGGTSAFSGTSAFIRTMNYRDMLIEHWDKK